MTQATLRLLTGGIIAVGLLAAVARGDDMNLKGFRGAAGANGTMKKQLKVGDTFLACAVDLDQLWSTRNQPSAFVRVMRVDGAVSSPAIPSPNNVETASLRTNIKQDQTAETERKRQVAKQYHIYIFDSPRPINSPNRSENEREVERRLDAPDTAFDYDDVPVWQILDDLASRSQINIVPDAPALKEAQINLDQRVSMHMEGPTLKMALNHLLQKTRMKYKVENDSLVIMPDGLVHPGLDCFTNPEGKANQGAAHCLSSNGLKLLGVDLGSQSMPCPQLPPSVPVFIPVQVVNCPINIPWVPFLGHGLPPKPVEPSSPLAAFMPPEPVYLDQAVSANFTFGFGVVFPR